MVLDKAILSSIRPIKFYLIGRLKNEFFHHRGRGAVTLDEFEESLGVRLNHCCKGHLKESSGWMSPDEYHRSLRYAARAVKKVRGRGRQPAAARSNSGGCFL